MTTALQYLASPKLSSLTVISGRYDALVQICTVEVLRQIGGAEVQELTAKGSTSADLYRFLYTENPYNNPQVLLYKQAASNEEGCAILRDYAQEPILSRYVIATNTEIHVKGSRSERWIPARHGILHVDCNYPGGDQLQKFLVAHSISAAQAAEIVDRCQADTERIWLFLQMAQQVDHPWAPAFLDSLLGDLPLTNDVFAQFLITAKGSDFYVCDRLLHRIKQLIIIRTLPKMQVYELAREIEEQTFVTSKLLRLAQARPARDWLQLAVKVALAKEHASDARNEVRAYLQALLW